MTKVNIMKFRENKFYILYRRIKEKGEIIPLYVIYYTENYGGGLCKEFYTRQEALRFFDRATKEAFEYEYSLD